MSIEMPLLISKATPIIMTGSRYREIKGEREKRKGERNKKKKKDREKSHSCVRGLVKYATENLSLF